MFDYKNASEEELKTQFVFLAKESGSDTFGTRKEFFCLPEILMDNEDVLAISSGFMDGNTWLIVLTTQRVLLLDKGMFFGLKQISIDLDQINAVSGSTGIMFGKIIIQDGAKSHIIEQVLKSSVAKFTSKVQDAISKRKMHKYAPAQTSEQRSLSTGDDFISQIEKLSSLLDKGILTPEEFDSAKKRILSTNN